MCGKDEMILYFKLPLLYSPITIEENHENQSDFSTSNSVRIIAAFKKFALRNNLFRA
jgi:hypothetical protein